MHFRIATINLDEVVVLGVTTMLAHHAPDIELVDIAAGPRVTVDVVLIDPVNLADEPRTLARLLADPRVQRVAC